MSRRSNLLVAAGAMAALILSGLPVAAQEPDGGPQRTTRGARGTGPAGPMGLAREFRQLALSDAQREQLRGLFQQHRSELQSTGERLRAAQRAVEEAVTARVIDESLIRQRVSERALVEADAAVLRAQLNAQAWQILTPEQQQKAEELKAQRQQRMEDRRQRMEERRRQRRQRSPQP